MYLNGKKHGKGAFKWTDGSKFEGEFEFNNINGKGIYKWSDGRSYEGEWKNNKMDGKGEFKWADGRKYIGNYKDDKKCGFGEFFWPMEESIWANGKMANNMAKVFIIRLMVNKGKENGKREKE